MVNVARSKLSIVLAYLLSSLRIIPAGTTKGLVCTMAKVESKDA